MLIDNIDLNIWDKLSYETSGEQQGGWVINTYAIVHDWAGFGVGEQLPWTIELRPRDAEALTLGIAEEDGGDYAPDEDFWLDYEGFKSVYKNIPRRVLRELDAVLDQLGRWRNG